MRRRRKERAGRESGLALLSALLAVALLTVIVLEMADSTLVHAHLSRNAGNALAAQILARSAIVAAEAILLQDRQDNPSRTGPDQYWSMQLPPIPTRNGTVGFTIVDEGGKLDLNRVGEENYRNALKALFEDRNVDAHLLDAVADWTSNDPEVAARAVTQYCALPMPCEPRRKQRLLAGLDDLRVIRGFDEATIQKLSRYVTALPKTQGVNVNTADARVLTALGCTPGGKVELPPGGFEKVSEATAELCKGVAASLLAVNSDVFSINAFGNVGDVVQGVQTTVNRAGKGKKVDRLTWRERPISAVTPPELP